MWYRACTDQWKSYGGSRLTATALIHQNLAVADGDPLVCLGLIDKNETTSKQVFRVCEAAKLNCASPLLFGAQRGLGAFEGPGESGR
ncbi:hypothetical protein EVAR_29377_1 [Eumeta japonica]|uniref:Uncharacterized protein n=1 Tax=Eumeta variegata TaxID=151549 RepID=A0A4C1YGL8_EUMVA|nr:hypothetical protein EVAR_29377_1 [Eumeta japonica]